MQGMHQQETCLQLHLLAHRLLSQVFGSWWQPCLEPLMLHDLLDVVALPGVLHDSSRSNSASEDVSNLLRPMPDIAALLKAALLAMLDTGHVAGSTTLAIRHTWSCSRHTLVMRLRSKSEHCGEICVWLGGSAQSQFSVRLSTCAQPDRPWAHHASSLCWSPASRRCSVLQHQSENALHRDVKRDMAGMLPDRDSAHNAQKGFSSMQQTNSFAHASCHRVSSPGAARPAGSKQFR